MNTEDYFKYSDDILMNTAEKTYYRDTAIGIYSQANTFLDIFADGAIRIGDSSAGAPTNYTAFSATGDIDMYGTANKIENHAGNLTIESAGYLNLQPTSGNVGIGTATPLSKLDLGLIISSSSTPSISIVDYQLKLSAYDASTGEYSNNIAFYTQGSPAVVAAISVVDEGVGGATGLTFSTGIYEGFGERVRIDKDGNVGIGTTTPDYILDIDAGEIGDNNYDGLRIIDTGWKAVSHPMLEFYNSHASFNAPLVRIYGEIGNLGENSKLYFAVADSSKNLQDRMVIDKDGNVGIGTDSPDTKLQVVGDCKFGDDDTNYTAFSATGDMVQVGTGRTFESEKYKSTAIGGYAVKLTNKTGSPSVAGQLVASSTGTDDAFAAVGANSEETIGIVLDAGIVDGSEVWVVESGIADTLIDAGGCTHGDRMIASATAGSADVWNVGGAVATHFREIGHCLETRVGAGLARVKLHFN